ncbi:MAG: hypothetical protein IKF80_08185 [Erysipelotrichaceae bacterium]|nr:hypothetical protein [Erysipelotrichaceae bacterium]
MKNAILVVQFEVVDGSVVNHDGEYRVGIDDLEGLEAYAYIELSHKGAHKFDFSTEVSKQELIPVPDDLYKKSEEYRKGYFSGLYAGLSKKAKEGNSNV